MATSDVIIAWMRGESMSSIARRAGVSRQRIGQRIQETGAKRPFQPPKPKPKPPPPSADLTFSWNETTGHWWAYSPFSKRTVRAAHAIAQRRLGRALRRKEYAVLLDGNPHNLDESNVAVMSPTEARAHRARRSRD